MSEKTSIQDYYYNQRRIAERYGVTDNHAGCYVTHYYSEICTKCKHSGKCYNIHEEEKRG